MKKNALLGFCLLTLAACGQDPEFIPSSECSAGSAAIGIGDGRMSILCGCDETGDGWVISSTGSLTCTVRSGTVVTFHYIPSYNSHQIVSASGSPDSFAPSPIYLPGNKAPSRAHAVTLSAGTYVFTDQYDQSASGQIIAN